MTRMRLLRWKMFFIIRCALLMREDSTGIPKASF